MKQKTGDARLVVLSLLLAALIGCAEPRAQEQSTANSLDDIAITEKVVDKLMDDPLFGTLGSLEIEVETSAGTVRLSGYVTRAEDQERAIELAGSVGGVQSVQNDIHILDVEPVEACCLLEAAPWPKRLRVDRLLGI